MSNSGDSALTSSAVSEIRHFQEKVDIQNSRVMLAKWIGKEKLAHAGCKPNQLIFLTQCLTFSCGILKSIVHTVTV